MGLAAGRSIMVLIFGVASLLLPVVMADEALLFRAHPSDCPMTQHIDYDGPAVRWGLAPAPPMNTSLECCRACQQFSGQKPRDRCTHWVFCPSSRCWSPDIWNHTFGECWLKWFDVTKQRAPKVNAKGAFPPAFREMHTTAPEFVQWVGGINAKATRVDGG